MVERVDQGQCRGTVKSSTIVESSRDAHRRLVDVGDAEVNLPHSGVTRGALEREILRQVTKFGDAFGRTWQLNYPALSMRKKRG